MSKSKDENKLKNKTPSDTGKPKTTLRQGILLSLISLVLFFALIEGGLALFGVDPVLKQEDPFIGFSGNVPLFTKAKAPNGKTVYTTAKNKLAYFNRQMFPAEKTAGTYRIFSLGGSTTYGRPYNDLTSFSGWLRELLPAADPTRNWEVINAGGISYASYRVARLMDELAEYRPDLFIVYTGQNEFLEERTYRDLKEMPEVLRTTVGLLAKTRTWAATRTLMQKTGMVPGQSDSKATRLASEVNAILDNSTGPEDYQRDDRLREGVLEHYRVSLERMADIARSAGAEIIFVTPASNLKECSPFKSEHSAALTAANRQQVTKLMAAARGLAHENDWSAALGFLDQAIFIDPRYAELHFLRGKALFALQRYDEALLAFQTARDEDICPLRALSPLLTVLADVARQNGVPLVDFEALVGEKMKQEHGHAIAGEELFLDHVHPTIEGHKLLAVSLVERMIALGLLTSDNWNDTTIDTAATRVYSRVDRKFQSKALINLAKVLHWAGKMEEAKRLAEKGLEMADGDPRLTAQASNVLIKVIKQEGGRDQVLNTIRQTLEIDPWSPMMHYQLGIERMKQEQRQKAAAHVLLAAAFWDTDKTNSMLGLTLFNNGRFDLAYPLLNKARQQNPGDRVTQLAFSQLSQQLGQQVAGLSPVKIGVRHYASGAPKEVFIQSQKSVDLPDGILTEWYENGSPKRYYELQHDIPHGIEKTWRHDGSLQSHAVYEKGIRTDR